MRPVLALLLLAALSAQALQPHDNGEALTRIAFGSCNQHHYPQPVWEGVKAYDPQVWIWGGDIVYADSDFLGAFRYQSTEKEVIRRFDAQKARPEYQAIVNSTQIVGVWDDHDYGINDGDHTHPTRPQAQNALLNFLDEPADSLRRKQAGVYATYVWGPPGKQVRVILLDIRYHQDYENDDMLGEAQWEWLRTTLANNEAQLTLFVSGIQIVQTGKPSAEGWKAFPKSRARFFELVASSPPTAVLLLTGDVHLGEMARTRVCRGDSMQTFYDLTSSGMTHGWVDMHGYFPRSVAAAFNRHLLPLILPRKNAVGEVLLEFNFGGLTIDWELEQLTATLRDPEGTPQRTFELPFSELRPSPLPADGSDAAAECAQEASFSATPRPLRQSAYAIRVGQAFVALVLLTMLYAVYRLLCFLLCFLLCCRSRSTAAARAQQVKKRE